MTTGRVNAKFRLEDQGLEGLGNVYYNLTEPALVEAALTRGEGKLGKGGAFLVTTGKFTGRSPKDKHVVKTPSVAEKIWWDNNAEMSPEGFDALYEDMMRACNGGRGRSESVVISLERKGYPEVFHGRLFGFGRAAFFEEESTWLRVQVVVPSHLTGRALGNWYEMKLFFGLRAKHKAAEKLATRSNRKALAESRNPKTPRDLQVKG